MARHRRKRKYTRRLMLWTPDGKKRPIDSLVQLPSLETDNPAPEAVNHPAHYGGEDNTYETIKVAEAKLTADEMIGAMKFEVMRYNDRHRQKGGFEDLRKALWYQARLVDYVQKRGLERSVGP